MCSIILHFDPEAPWPMVIGANRDEMAGRPWRAPGRHWDDHPHVIAGIDEEAGGTWMGVNDDGVMAAVLNRSGSLGPAAGKRSRGELPLEALSHAEAKDAAEALAHLDGRAYRSFNLVIADIRGAFWLRSDGENAQIEVEIVPPGVAMLTAHDLNDIASTRIATYLPRFRDAPRPDPDADDWSAWSALLSDRSNDGAPGEKNGMTVGDSSGFGTVSSSMIALPGPERFGQKPVWYFASGAPDVTPYAPVSFAS